jgi:hypothetical protein
MSDFMAVSPLGGGLINRLHWRKRFGAGKGANELIFFPDDPWTDRKFTNPKPST